MRMVMIAMLKGNPLIRREGDHTIERTNAKTLLWNVPLKSAMRIAPTMVVVTHVSANSRTFSQGNGRAVSSANTAGREKVLSMKAFDERLQRLQIFAGLEPHSFSGRDIHFGTRARIAADPRLARFDGKDAKAAQLNPIV